MNSASSYHGSWLQALAISIFAAAGGVAIARFSNEQRNQRRSYDDTFDESSDTSDELSDIPESEIKRPRRKCRNRVQRTHVKYSESNIDPSRLHIYSAARDGRILSGSSSYSRLQGLKQEMHKREVLNDGEIARSMGFSEYQGFSMEDARRHCEKEMASQKDKTPLDVVRELQRGNARFWMGMSSRPEISAFERRALIMQQFPTVAVLGCSDSRVPVEIVFDQGLGDMFVVRVAGNALSSAPLASLEYAVKHLEVKVIVVMGHEGCGAIKAATQPLEKINDEPESLATLLRELKASLSDASYTKIIDSRARDREMVTCNVRLQVDMFRKDDSIISRVRANELIIAGAFYEISSGIVDFVYTLDSSNV